MTAAGTETTAGTGTTAGAGTTASRSHPIFARLFERLARAGERGPMGRDRARLLAGASGRAIEVGAGSGANFHHYPAQVNEVLAIEPEPYLRARAIEAAAAARANVTVLAGEAAALPAEDASFDFAVYSLVLCSVEDQAAALAEARRVLRPGGELRFYEHVRSARALPARIQLLADATFWPSIAGGCHMARETLVSIESAGFAVEECERHGLPFAPKVPGFTHILGRARRV